MSLLSSIVKNYLLPPALYSCALQIYDALSSFYRSPYLHDNSNFKNLRRTEDCFIIGNGPSLLHENLSNLASYDCFVSNEFYAVKDSNLVTPLIHTAADPVPETISIKNYTDFLPDFDRMARSNNTYYLFHLTAYRAIKSNQLPFQYPDNVYPFIGQIYQNKSTCNFTKCVGPCRFSSMVNTLLAIYMGYKNVYLIGMDQDTYYNFFCHNKNIVNHAYSDNKSGASVRPPEITNYSWITASLAAYKTYSAWNSINQLSKKTQSSIYDLTSNGCLDIFEKISMSHL